MFETAELGRKLSRQEYKQRVPELRTELLEAQRKLLADASFPTIVVFAGWWPSVPWAWRSPTN